MSGNTLTLRQCQVSRKVIGLTRSVPGPSQQALSGGSGVDSRRSTPGRPALTRQDPSGSRRSRRLAAERRCARTLGHVDQPAAISLGSQPASWRPVLDGVHGRTRAEETSVAVSRSRCGSVRLVVELAEVAAHAELKGCDLDRFRLPVRRDDREVLPLVGLEEVDVVNSGIASVRDAGAVTLACVRRFPAGRCSAGWFRPRRRPGRRGTG